MLSRDEKLELSLQMQRAWVRGDIAERDRIAKILMDPANIYRATSVINPEWRNLRKAAIERDGGKCVKCGSTVRLEADHIIPASEGGVEMSLENIQTLCHSCHKEKTRDELKRRHAEYGF